MKRTAQISPDRLTVGFFAISLVIIVMASSMVFSYVGIAEAAAWTGVPSGIHVIAPIFIDGAIITYTVSLTIFEWRREDRRMIRHTKRVLRGFTALSVGLNFAHTASYWRWDFTAYEAWFGSLISISAPIAALLSAEEVVRLAFRRRAIAASEEQPSTPIEPTIADVTWLEPRTSSATSTPTPPEEAFITVPIGTPVPAEAPALDTADVIAEAERLTKESAFDQPEHDGIVRYPAQGEVLLRFNDDGAVSREL
ncbi:MULTISPECIES: DUF2637 domain-containing protein [Microbacterium]|uniref:DUF2637 domain-containing protein n=1 Tax=Microbacterium TaxID=33882 RepID=UPI0003A0F528|nr:MULTISPECIES: DUF2637 domain-containing protein [Microbacterium]